MRNLFRIALLTSWCLISLLPRLMAESAAHKESHDMVLSTMQHELQRANTELGKMDPAPYFISYSVHDQDWTVALGSQGALISSTSARRRFGDIIMRVGAAGLDNSRGGNRRSAINSETLPLGDDPDATARVLWQLTYREYRKASQAYLNTKTKTQVQAQQEDTSADFSQEAAQVYADDVKAAVVPEQQKAFEDLVRRYSAYFRKYPYIYSSLVMVMAQSTRSRLISTEGTNVVTPSAVVRLAIQAETRAEDGMELVRVETFQADDANHLPAEGEIESRMEKLSLIHI